MDYRKLKSFLALASNLHFARAAAEVGLTQPALSQHIHALEKSWDIKLFERNKRRVSLTTEGRLLLVEIQQTVDRLENLQKVVRTIASGQRGVLRLGYVGTSVLEPLLVRAIREFRSAYPEVRLLPVEHNIEQQFSLLHSGELDIGLVRNPLPLCSRLRYCDIHKTALSVVVPVNHRLVKQTDVHLDEFIRETILLQDDPDGVGLGGTVIGMFMQQGWMPENIIRTKDVNTATDLTALGMGITFIPTSQVNMIRKDVVPLRIRDASAVTSLTLCWKEAVSNPYVPLFIKQTKSLFENTGDMPGQI